MDTESFEIKGRIDAVSQKMHEEGESKGLPKRYSVMIGKNWYSGFGKSPWDKGDLAHFMFVPKGEYKNILKILDDDSAKYMSSEKAEPLNEMGEEQKSIHPAEFGMVFNKAVDMAIWEFGDNKVFWSEGPNKDVAIITFRETLMKSFHLLWEAENSLREEYKIGQHNNNA